MSNDFEVFKYVIMENINKNTREKRRVDVILKNRENSSLRAPLCVFHRGKSLGFDRFKVLSVKGGKND